MTRLFQEQNFIGHSGDELHWKIECDALFPEEWRCIAKMITEYETRPFCSAIGIPRGGVRLGTYLNVDGALDLVDRYQLFEVAKYCDELVPDGKGGTEPRFSCNVYISKTSEAIKVLKDLLTASKNKYPLFIEIKPAFSKKILKIEYSRN